MKGKLAKSLMRSKSAANFLRRRAGRIAHQDIFALKKEVDRLVGCDLDSASRLADRVGELARLIGDSPSIAMAEAGRARVLDQQGNHLEANRIYERAVGGMRSAGFRVEAAIVQKQQVHALFCLNRYGDALRIARAARRTLAATDPIELAQLEANVGNVYYRLERYNKALEHYDKALETMCAVEDEVLRAPTDFNRANILLEMDRVDEAMAVLEKVASAFKRAGHGLQAAQTRFHLAYLEFKRGNYNAALAAFYQVRDKLEELGSAELVAYCDQDIADIMLALNAFEDAAARAAAARAHFAALDMGYESAQAATVRALALMGLDRFDEARQHLAEAREVFSSRRNAILTALVDAYLAELALRREDYAEASKRAGLSLRAFARHRLPTRSAYARLLAARAAYGSGEKAKAGRMARAALDAVKGLHAHRVAYQCHHLLGMIERDRGKTSEAVTCFMRAVGVVEQMRDRLVADELKTSFLKDKIGVYEDAILTCLDQGGQAWVEEAFRLVEASKSRALADLLARYARGAGEGEEKSEAARTRARLSKVIESLNWYSSQAEAEDEAGKRRAPSVVARYRQKVAECERQVAQLYQRLETESPTFANMQRLRAASVSDLRDALEEGETAIEYFIAGDEVSAFVVTRDRMNVARNIASLRDVEGMLAALRFQLEKFGYNGRYIDKHSNQLKLAVDECCARLYEAIFEPLELMIADDKLVIIPHGLLHYVPFHALSDGRDYLVDLFTISRAPSAAVLKLCRERARRLGPGFENANHAQCKLVALGAAGQDTPNIPDEIHALGEIFPGAVKLTGGRATRKGLLRYAPRARFLHIASHGYFRTDNPMFSFLKLADTNLHFYSLFDLELRAEMVTLSACQTGVNAVFPGDELHGLARGFLYAGAPTLVVSLWAVSDRSTAEMMGEMYARIRRGASKREALREAQLKIKQSYPHPYYWAPFVLMGNPN